MTELETNVDPQTQRERLHLVPIKGLRCVANAPATPQISSALVESIRTYGVLQPLIVRPVEDSFEVVAGFKRLAAAREAGLTLVPARVYRVEDAAVEGLQAATNVTGDRRRPLPNAPSAGTPTFKSTGRLSGLLEEELNRPPPEVPYRIILSCAAVILLVFWGGLELSRRWKNREGNPPRARPTPQEVSVPPRPGEVPTLSPATTPAIDLWKRNLSGIDGIEIRNVDGSPRIVFNDPVFSRLTTLDPSQELRLARVAKGIQDADPTVQLVIIGHTDNVPVRTGSPYGSNEQLGQLRAEAVVEFLSSRNHFPSARIRKLSVGSDKPPFTNDTPEGKVRNRTVTLEILQPRT